MWRPISWLLPATARRLLAVMLLAALAVACGSPGPTGTSPWWAGPPGLPPSACAWPAVYRTASATDEGLGNCGGNFFDPPADVRLHVGEELDLHMTAYAPAGSTAPVPEYPLPSSPDDRVLRLDTVSDAGATGAYSAIAPGVVTLASNGWCFHLATNTEATGACPVVRVTVAA